MRYEIRVEGVLDARWSEWFEGMQISTNVDGTTTIAGQSLTRLLCTVYSARSATSACC